METPSYSSSPNVHTIVVHTLTSFPLIEELKAIYSISNDECKEAIRAKLYAWLNEEKTKEAFAKSKEQN